MREGRAEEPARRDTEPLVAAGQGRVGFRAGTQGHAAFPRLTQRHSSNAAATQPGAVLGRGLEGWEAATQH